MTPLDVRERLVEALRLDLIGPSPEDAAYQTEVLDTAPSQHYLGGFLVPMEATDWQRGSTDVDDQLDVFLAPDGPDDEQAPEAQASNHKNFFPSSLGLSFLCPKETATLDVEVTWGDYRPHQGAALGPAAASAEDDLRSETSEFVLSAPSAPALSGGPSVEPPPPSQSAARRLWHRSPGHAVVSVPLLASSKAHPVPGSRGLVLVATVRPVPTSTPVRAGSCAVSVFLVNRRRLAPDKVRDVGYVFQAALRVRCTEGFVPRPDLRGQDAEEWESKVADLQYADVMEYAVGHNVSATAEESPNGTCREVRTVFVPTALVEKVVPAQLGVELSMEALAQAPDADTIQQQLSALPAAYHAWITGQVRPDDPERRKDTETLLKEAETARGRIVDGIAALSDPDIRLAFQLANRAIAQALRQRNCHGTDKDPAKERAPTWYPFQLAFLLLNLSGLVNPAHKDRTTVDLLFFPTGGGKTEAYLGLAAFTLLLRRLRADPKGPGGCGVTVLMRYTLRLLTLDQLGRAATLICALELIRRERPERLGTWPFEIGLWVGRSATPNRMGKKGDNDDESARSRTIAFQNDDKRKPPPIPIEKCPWCGRDLKATSFQLVPRTDLPQDLRVQCASRCPFNGTKQPLPIVAVDEPLYRRLPAFLIATVDKFAGLPWVGQIGALFGRVERYDADGFYGPSDPGRGKPLPGGRLPPPDLVIQDELHLISGPLGTMVGLYETAIDALCSAEKDLGAGGARPKIVASTATVRRAEHQIQALFGRKSVSIFPPPGPNRRDSFFAKTVAPAEMPARLYVGLSCPGRSLKVLWALYAFLRSPGDYMEVIRTAIVVGGDVDSTAGIAGALAGAALGVEGLPGELLNLLSDRGGWTAEELAALAVEACRTAFPGS